MASVKRSSSKQTGRTGKTGRLPQARHVYRKAGQPYPLDFRVKAVQLLSQPRGGLDGPPLALAQIGPVVVADSHHVDPGRSVPVLADLEGGINSFAFVDILDPGFTGRQRPPKLGSMMDSAFRGPAGRVSWSTSATELTRSGPWLHWNSGVRRATLGSNPPLSGRSWESRCLELCESC